jgi:putative peptidoglycan lipid II flippase
MSTSALSTRQLARAALVVLLGFAASGLLGLLRQSVIAATFGASAALDSYFAAQRIPEMLFVLVAGGALGSSFIPVFTRFLQAKDHDGAWRLARAVMRWTLGAAVALALLIALLAQPIVATFLAPDAPPERIALIVNLTRIMLLTVPIFAVSGLMMGILNAHQSFTLPALAAALYNVGQIVGALVLARALPTLIVGGEASANVYGLAWGVVLGAGLHLAIQVPGLRRINTIDRRGADVASPAAANGQTGRQTHGSAPTESTRVGGTTRASSDTSSSDMSSPAVTQDGRDESRPYNGSQSDVPRAAREVLLLMLPRVLGLAVVQVNFVVNVALAYPPRMVEGSVSAFTYAWTLMFFALGVVAQSVGTALFPSLAALAAVGDWAGYRERLSGAMRAVLFLALPATAAMIALGEPIIRALFERGAWTRTDSSATAWALAFLAIGVAGHALLELLARAFYALADTRTPVTVGIGAMIANITLSLLFVQFIGDPNDLARGAFAGLALANALTTLVEAGVLWWLLRRRIGALYERQVFATIGTAGTAALLMGAVVWGVSDLAADYGVWAQVIGGGAVGGAVFFGLALLLRADEARGVMAVVMRRIRRG